MRRKISWGIKGGERLQDILVHLLKADTRLFFYLKKKRDILYSPQLWKNKHVQETWQGSAKMLKEGTWLQICTLRPDLTLQSLMLLRRTAKVAGRENWNKEHLRRPLNRLLKSLISTVKHCCAVDQACHMGHICVGRRCACKGLYVWHVCCRPSVKHYTQCLHLHATKICGISPHPGTWTRCVDASRSWFLIHWMQMVTRSTGKILHLSFPWIKILRSYR